MLRGNGGMIPPGAQEMAVANRFRPGDTIEMYTLADCRQYSMVVAQASKFGLTAGQTYTVMEATPAVITLVNRRKQRFRVKPMDLIKVCVKRVGPISEELLQPRMAAQAIADGQRFRRGDIIILTETGGTTFGYENTRGGTGAVQKQEFLFAFQFV